MATAFVALIRGINVGRAKRVAMADLRALLGDLGYGDVRTLLNSGNAVFSAPDGTSAADVGARIEQAIASKLSVAARVMAVDSADLAAAIAENPFAEHTGDPSHLLVGFLSHVADRAPLARLAERDWAPEAIVVGEHALYLWCPNGVADSPVGRATARVLGDSVTARNWTTLLKLRAMVELA